MTKELRKSLRLWLESFTRLQTELEKLNTEENQAILNQYPIIDKCWQHPQSHLMLRAFELIENTRKTMSKIVGALPAERKTKVVKFIEPKPSKEKSLSEQTKSSKKGKGAKRPKTTSPPEESRSSGDKKRKSGDAGKLSGDGIQQKIQRTRKPRSDKGKKRG